MSSKKILRPLYIYGLFIASLMMVGTQPVFAGGSYKETQAEDDCIVKKIVRLPRAPGNGRFISIEHQPCPGAEFAASEAQEGESLTKPRKICRGSSRGLRPPYYRSRNC